MFIILHFAFIQFQVIIFSYINIFIFLYAATAKSLQSCLTLCDPIDGSPLGSSVPGILQARILGVPRGPSQLQGILDFSEAH